VTLKPELVQPELLEPANDSASLLNGSLPIAADSLLPIGGVEVSEEVDVQRLPAAATDVSFLQSLKTSNSAPDNGPEFMIDEAEEPAGSVDTFETIEFESPATSEVEADSEFLEVAPLPPTEPAEFLPPIPADE
jgi:hypothetical protein